MSFIKRSQNERLILHFHGVGPVPNRVGPEEQIYWCQKDRFASILDAICALSRMARIEITFDDGNSSDNDIALPALADRGLTAIFFVCAGRIGVPGYLDSVAMRNLISAGMEIGSHGWGHVDWRRVDDECLDVEVDDSRRQIADIIGRGVDKVSLPFGSYDRRVLRRLRRSDIKTVFTSDGGRAALTGWLLPREVFKASWDDNRTLVELATRPVPALARIRRSVKQFAKHWR